MCVCELYKCILVAIDELCKVLGTPERWGAVQLLMMMMILLLIVIIIMYACMCTLYSSHFFMYNFFLIGHM